MDVAEPSSFEGAQLAFFAATGELSRTLAPAAVTQGALVIDKSNSWRLDANVPLVVPEVNAPALGSQRGIIACPNCTTIGLVVALEPLRRAFGLRSVVATTFQAVSGAGRDGLAELTAQELSQSAGGADEVRVFPGRIARNVLAQCDAFAPDGYTAEEHKLRSETRKILALPTLGVSVTAVRVPVAVGHSVAALVEGDEPIDAKRAAEVLQRSPGVRWCDDGRVPTPQDVENSDAVWVGRVRPDLDSRRLWLWSVSNNVRKGAATNAIQIAETLLRQGAFASNAAAASRAAH